MNVSQDTPLYLRVHLQIEENCEDFVRTRKFMKEWNNVSKIFSGIVRGSLTYFFFFLIKYRHEQVLVKRSRHQSAQLFDSVAGISEPF